MSVAHDRAGLVHVSMVVVHRPQAGDFDARAARGRLGAALRQHLQDRALTLSGPAQERVEPVPDTGATRYVITALALPRG